MILSPNFRSEEFEKDGPIPSADLSIFCDLALEVLEPIRAQLNRPVIITSGYRSPKVNQLIHGVANSEHVATPAYCAADFVWDIANPKVYTCRMLFDWIRSNPNLPFHQVILESNAKGGSIIHCSFNSSTIAKGERQALVGATYNSAPYSTADVVPFAPELA